MRFVRGWICSQGGWDLLRGGETRGKDEDQSKSKGKVTSKSGHAAIVFDAGPHVQTIYRTGALLFFMQCAGYIQV
jgi:hypothetical protein